MINHQNGLDEWVASLWELVWPTIPSWSSTHLGWLGGPLQWAGRWSSIGIVTITTTVYSEYYHSTSRSWNMITNAVPPWDGISSLWTFCPWRELITMQLFHWNRCDHYQVPRTMGWNFPLKTLVEVSVPEPVAETTARWASFVRGGAFRTRGKLIKYNKIQTDRLNKPLSNL